MSPVSSALPQSAHTAAQQALQAALNDPSSKPPTSSTASDDAMDSNNDPETTPRDEELEGQEIEAPAGLGSLPLNETARTIFEDPMTFNVKVWRSLPLLDYPSFSLCYSDLADHDGLIASPVHSLDPLVRFTANQGQGRWDARYSPLRHHSLHTPDRPSPELDGRHQKGY